MPPLAPMCAGLWAESVVAAANSNATAASPLGCNIFSFLIFFFLCSVTSEQRRAERYAAAAAAAAAFKPCSQNRLDFYSLINRREAQKWPSAWNPLNGSPHTISRGRFCGNSREKKADSDFYHHHHSATCCGTALWHLLRLRCCAVDAAVVVVVVVAVAFDSFSFLSAAQLHLNVRHVRRLQFSTPTPTPSPCRGACAEAASVSASLSRGGRPKYKLRSKHFEFIIILCKWILLINVPCVKC